MVVKKKIYSLDGYDALTNNGNEFHGCLFHGYPKCYKPATFNTIKQETMGSIYKQHVLRINFLKMNLNHLYEIWECEWDQLTKTDSELMEMIKNENDIRPDLKPRDALFGGRTNAAVLYYKVKDDEKIKYYDFTSVYPAVMKMSPFPIGFPVFKSLLKILIILMIILDLFIARYFHLKKCFFQ